MSLLRREVGFGVGGLLVLVAMLWCFFSATVEAAFDRREVLLRFWLGADAYGALTHGKASKQHYLGDDKKAPAFELKDARGKLWRLSDHRGKVVVLNFWTRTCAPCLEEMPSLIELAALAKTRQDLEVVAVSTDKNWDEVRSVVPVDSPLTVLLDADKHVVKEKFGTKLYPETWVIDGQGVIRMRIDGPRDWSTPVAVDVLSLFN